MATFKVTNIKNIKSALKMNIIRSLRDKEIRDSVGNIVANEIQSTIFKTAEASTQRTRKYLEQGNQTHPTYSREKINITFTGELLDDLRKNVKLDSSEGALSFIVENSNKKHKKYKTKKGKPIKGVAKTHSEIAGYLKDYLNFDKLKPKSIAKLTESIQQSLLTRLRQLYKV